jgi:CHAT domain-containing protein
MGLTRAWLLAGSHAVVATYWPVVDDVGLMLENFYRSLSESGSPPLALRHAQLAMLARDDFRAQPRYWASCFIFSRGL